MPVYVYYCATCAREFDVTKHMNDPNPDTCPSCGAPTVEWVPPRMAFALKGGGWAASGYSKGGVKR